LSPDFAKQRNLDSFSKTNQLSPLNPVPLSPTASSVGMVSSPGKLKRLKSNQTDYSSESFSSHMSLSGKLSSSMNSNKVVHQLPLQSSNKLELSARELSPRIIDGWLKSELNIGSSLSPVGTNVSFPSPLYSQNDLSVNPYHLYRHKIGDHQSDHDSDSVEVEGAIDIDPVTRSFTEDVNVLMSGVTLPFKYESCFYE